jgi:hypothetical protein
MLLLHLLRELKRVRMRRHIGHLSLHLEIRPRQVLLGLYHAHINVLLMRRSNLLLLLLEDFDLLCDSKLFHYGNDSSVSRPQLYNLH